MSYLDAIIIAIIEGLTEFLPISSTGHMIVVSHFLGLSQDDFVTSFEIIIQFAAIIAVVFYYRHQLRMAWSLWKQIVLAFLPVALVGFVGATFFTNLFSVKIVAWAFIVGGIIFLFVERWYGTRAHDERDALQALQNMSYRQALGVGIAQACSLIPGTSRSGATIVGGMLSGLTRAGATTFSFFVAVPVLASVTGYALLRHSDVIFTKEYSMILFIGFLFSFLVAYGTIIFLVRFVATHRLVGFGVYRILFGLLLLLFFA